ncbi:MAG: heavy-metal-associated domain-containing protein [Alphaproteobacteria bacterium]|mgnify:FL=1|jgi:copper chaperone|nr:heavy-metal-associated domain-containing protein [Alphaproteobacteria bacterium]MBU1548771.1 heavy-metal-associated domain-containing protein [Alphaproteobacteria bacterium]MBU2335597.1 heavy-metal-associated domain-containing protein [Alphaproteobacteria bacterium]MBU2391008.1 heavy-metal-associated domain-containing protein [Alphaproteobacteria bacterium]
MYKFQIPDMTCGHCVASVEKAIKGVDPNASAEIDLGSKTASVVSSVPADVIEKAIAEAGYGASLAKSCCR